MWQEVTTYCIITAASAKAVWATVQLFIPQQKNGCSGCSSDGCHTQEVIQPLQKRTPLKTKELTLEKR